MRKKEVLLIKKFNNYKELNDYAVLQLERELNLINNRLSWMLTFQGFLFTTIALTANNNTDWAIGMGLRYGIPSIGMLVAFLALFGIHAAHLSITNIRTRWKWNGGYSGYSLAFGNPDARKYGRIPSYGIPISIIIAWLAWFVWLLFFINGSTARLPCYLLL
jgi:hypothetical protein